MRFLIFILILLFLSPCFSQNVIDKKFKESAKIIERDSLKLNVTLNVTDTVSLVVNGSTLKVILPKQESQSDYFKYIFPIITLLLGIGINRGLDYLSDRKKIKKTGERWAAEIRCLEKPIGNQILALEIFRNEHQKEKWDIPDLEIQTILNCEIFKSLDKVELIKYIKSVKNKSFAEAILASNSIHGFISILTSNYELLQKKFDEYLTARSNYTTEYSKSLQALMRAFANYQVALENELQKHDLTGEQRYEPIAHLFQTQILPHYVSGDYDIYILETKFFRPLVEILAHLRHDPKINEMSEAISSCLSNSRAIKMEKDYLTENLVTLTLRYAKALKEIPEILKTLE